MAVLRHSYEWAEFFYVKAGCFVMDQSSNTQASVIRLGTMPFEDQPAYIL